MTNLQLRYTPHVATIPRIWAESNDKPQRFKTLTVACRDTGDVTIEWIWRTS
jgi:hypothetical protein